ncbi:MAG TPA: vWA domain-containing protein, partial [Nannocystis sp.]
MAQPFDADTTRLERAAEAIESLIDVDNGFITDNFILGLMRFGSDPDPVVPDTAVPGDVTGLRDGVKLDVPWYDELALDKQYFQCTDGGQIVAALAGLPAPPDNVGSWTRGALEFTKAYLAQSEADHPQDKGKRGAAVIVYTTGTWTDATGAQKLAPDAANPASTASELLGLGMPTHVVNLGGAPGKLLADPLAKAGGTGQALDVDDLQGATDAFAALLAALKDEELLPVCEPDSPRVMFMIDASSAMLNVGSMHGEPGQAAWDQVREALAGEASVLQAVVGGHPLDEVGRFGVVAFGGNDPGDQTLVMQYDYCPQQRIAWGLDPASSCEAPGCVDPYAPPPIVWTSQNGAEIDPPGFDQDVLSHMPRCDLDPQTPAACTGSGRFTHLGLERVANNLAAYRAQCLMPDSPEPCDAATPFINILITDGPYDSTDAQVQAQLVSLFDAGMVTRVFGLGDAVDPSQLEAMAGWGSGGAFPASFVADGDDLADAIA